MMRFIVRYPLALVRLLFCFGVALPRPAGAIPASPLPFETVQGDGTRLSLYVRGDEHTNWFEDMAGYSVVKNGANFVYTVRAADGRLAPSGLLVGKVAPAAAGLPRKATPSMSALNAGCSQTRRILFIGSSGFRVGVEG